MNISEFMQQDFITVDINDTVKKVAALLKDENIYAVPVMEEGRPVGIISHQDVALAFSPEDPVSQAMNEDIMTINQDLEVEEALKIMHMNSVHSLLVMENEKLVGMINLHELSP